MPTPPARILIADDEPLFLKTTGELLTKAGYECRCVADAPAALQLLAREHVDLILSDLNMPGNLGLELLHEGRSKWPEVPLIVITGVPSLPTAVESLRLGIADYLLKPVSYRDLLSAVRRALGEYPGRPRGEAAESDSSRESAARFPEIVGECAQLSELGEIIERVSRIDTNILITGESGTGKEIVARAIHRHSRRAALRFQVIDCTTIPENLFESVLFGHAQGSFTGALRDAPGAAADSAAGAASAAFCSAAGRSDSSIHVERARAKARSITFRSSRTLPGQGYCRIRSSASGVNPRSFFPVSLLNRSRKYAANSSTSWLRFRKGGTTISTTLHA